MTHQPNLFDAAAILIVVTAFLGYVNFRFLKLPSTVGLTIMGAVSSLAVILFDRVFPQGDLAGKLGTFLADIDFHTTLMNGMLSFLLFAGALHVDWTAMKRGRWPIMIFSTVGVLLSTTLVGTGIHFIAGLFGHPIPLIWCLVFGALISPTDPIAVMAVMRRAAVPETLQATIAGESLFNDGIGVVVFSILLVSASGAEEFTLAAASADFLREAGGGAILGLVLGWIAFRGMRSIDDFIIEVMISLALVMGGYSLAQVLHVSGPVAMAVAGLMIGNAGVAYAMSEQTRDYLLKFWDLIDEILNAVLFVLIGLEVVVIASSASPLLLGVVAIGVVMLARAISVGAPLAAMKRWIKLGPMAYPTLVWGGLRGGISVALALSLPESPIRADILAITYIVVLFSVVVQGGSIRWLIERLSARAAQGTA
ncbi:sodium:proton antiporter [Novosphingobium sp.]|uniref:cation:proton antiporter n=1 Tax=Novosphingobium sp. TaxID=1874826 RepID=UPI0025F1D391|nr:sodium:proton antiporter [Novosphingobium sp.]